MKQNYKTMLLITPILGTAGMLLRFWLLGTGYDEKGLLIAFHPASIGCWLLTFALLASLALLTRGMKATADHRRTFPASIPAAALTALGAVGIGINAITHWTAAANPLASICGLFGICAALALGFSAWCRYQGKRPGFLPLTAVTVYFMLLLVYQYRSWMAEPQLDSYCFALLFIAGMMLSCFYRATLDNGVGKLALFVRFSLATAFFAFLAMPGSKDWFFIGTSGAYLLAELYTLQLPKRKKAHPTASEGA